MMKKVWENTKALARKCVEAVKETATAVKVAVIGAVAFVGSVFCPAKAKATALMEISAANITDLTDTVTGASSGSYSIYLLIVAFAIVWALTRRLKGK